MEKAFENLVNTGKEIKNTVPVGSKEINEVKKLEGSVSLKELYSRSETGRSLPKINE